MDEDEYVVVDRVLMEQLDALLMDHDILMFWKLTPFKHLFGDAVNLEHFEVEHIGVYHLDQYELNMAEWLGISKWFVVLFNVQFMAYYRSTVELHESLKNDGDAMFELLDYEDVSAMKMKRRHQSEGRESVQFQAQCLEEFVRFNNSHFFKRFLHEFHLKTLGLNHDEAVPIALEEVMVCILGDAQCESLILNYSWYISFISLFAFWKSLFADIDEMAICSGNRMTSVARITDTEWMTTKIKDSLTVLGLQYRSQCELLQILRKSSK